MNTLARSGIGIAVRADSASARVDSLPELVNLLIGARSVAYSRAVASGIYFCNPLERLGVADQVNRTARVVSDTRFCCGKGDLDHR